MNSETNRGEIVLKQLVDVMGRAMNYLETPDSPAGEQIKSIFEVVKDYTYALDTLDSYDYQALTIKSTTKEQFHATYEDAMAVIMELMSRQQHDFDCHAVLLYIQNRKASPGFFRIHYLSCHLIHKGLDVAALLLIRYQNSIPAGRNHHILTAHT